MQVHALTLREYQQQLIERIRATASSNATSSHLGVEAGGQRWTISLADVSEVIPTVPLIPVPMTQTWFAGMANVRGSLYAVTDFSCFVNGTTTPTTPECRFVLLHERFRVHAALLVRRSLGLRQLLNDADASADTTSWYGTTHSDADGGIWQELRVSMLIKDSQFLSVRR
jgi:twitching motility protein PilI